MLTKGGGESKSRQEKRTQCGHEVSPLSSSAGPRSLEDKEAIAQLTWEVTISAPYSSPGLCSLVSGSFRNGKYMRETPRETEVM